MKYTMGPFAKLDKPILSPNPEATFNCPILNKLVRWEEQNVYNPAAVVKDGKVFILYALMIHRDQRDGEGRAELGLLIAMMAIASIVCQNLCFIQTMIL